MNNPAELVTIKVSQLSTALGFGYWWNASVSGMMIGDDLTVEYSSTAFPGILDSGSTCMTMPSNLYVILRNKLLPLLTGYAVDE